MQAAASQSRSGKEAAGNQGAPRRLHYPPLRVAAARGMRAPARGPGNQGRACACAKVPLLPAFSQLVFRCARTSGRPSRGGNSRDCACAFQLSCWVGRGDPRLQVIPPLPLSTRPIARRWVGFSRRWPAHELHQACIDWLAPRAQVRASHWVWAERGQPRLLRRLQVGACTRRGSGPSRVRACARARRGGGGAQDCGACIFCSAPSSSAVAPAAETRREGAASPPAAPPVRLSVPPCEEPAERSSVQRPEPRPSLCRCLLGGARAATASRARRPRARSLRSRRAAGSAEAAAGSGLSMNRSHRHGAGSGCLGTMEVKSKVRGAWAGWIGRPDGGRDPGPGEGRGWPGTARGAAAECGTVGGAVVGFGGWRWWIIHLLSRKRGWGLCVCSWPR